MAEVAAVGAGMISEAAVAAADAAVSAAGAAAAADAAAEDDAEAAEMDWKAQAEEYKGSGNDAFKAGRWQEAVDWYTKAIELDPEERVYYSNRSAAYLKLGDAKSKALKDAEKCMELGFDWPKAYSRLGAAQHALRRYEAALATFQKGLTLEPDNKALKDGIAAAEAGKEIERKARWEAARIEREVQEAEMKAEDEARARQKKAAATAVTSSSNGSNGNKTAAAAAGDNSGDPLSSFLSDIKGEAEAPVMHQVERVMNDKYTAQALGTPEQQMNRLLGPNYKWKNLNPYEVMMLDTDATAEDIKVRYRKLSTLVHPDKRLDMPQARDAFEEVKKAYQYLMDETKRTLAAATIEAVRSRVAKERARLKAKGVTEEVITAQHGTAEIHAKKAIMKEFANVEIRRREIDTHKQAQKKRERDTADAEQEQLKATFQREKEWNEEDGREARVGSWRDFGKQGKVPKKSKMWKEETKKDEGKPKFGALEEESYKKNWK